VEGVIGQGRVMQVPGVEHEETGLGFKGRVGGFHDIVRRERGKMRQGLGSL